MRWLPAISGAVATASAAAVLVALAGHPSSVPTPSEKVAAPPSRTIVLETPTDTTVIGSQIDTAIAGLDPVLSSALVATGYAERLTPSELAGELDPVVTQALAESDTVLVIPNTGGG